ncbi:MAG: hypothetical protein AAB152_01570 [Candidatus Coatesbacteria bacterium]
MLPALAAALIITGCFAWKRNAPFDVLDWALLAYAAAWQVAGLAAPWDFPAALRAAIPLVGGPLLCICLRAAFPPRDGADRLRARLAAAALVAGALAVVLAVPPAIRIPRSDLAAAARLAFTQHPVFGWGPGQFGRFTSRWLPAARGVSASAEIPGAVTARGSVTLDPPDLYRHHLTDGGLVVAAALVLLVAAAFVTLLPPAFGRRADPAARVGLAAIAGWLVWGLYASPLLAAGPMLALMVALGLAAPTRLVRGRLAPSRR